MTKNLGLMDRLFRIGLGGLLLYLGLGTYSGSTLGMGLAIAAAIPTFTALLGFCPIYRLLGIHTNVHQLSR